MNSTVKKITIIFAMMILVNLFSVSTANSASAQTNPLNSPVLQAILLSQNPNPARAGGIFEVRLKLENTGGAEAQNIWVEFVPEYPFQELEEEHKKIISSIPNFPKEVNSAITKFNLKIDREATEGEYKIKFRYSTNKGSTWIQTDFNVDISAREIAQIFYIDRSTLTPGKETELKFTINNLGNAPLQNMIFSWNEAKGVILPVKTDNTRYIKYLEPGESMDLAYTVIASVNTPPDLYSLDLNLKYDTKNSTGGQTKEVVTTKAGIFIGGETEFDVTFSESTQGQTSLSVANVGSNPALSVAVRIPQQEGFNVMGSRDSIVGNLDKGDYTIVSFNIISGGMNFTGERRQTGASQVSAEELERIRQQFRNQNTNLKVIIDYTDTTGMRQTVKKTVPVQFRTGGTSETASASGGMHARSRQTTGTSSWLSTAVIILIAIVALFIYYKKKSEVNKIIKTVLNKISAKK